jgi:hypothetical protein
LRSTAIRTTISFSNVPTQSTQTTSSPATRSILRSSGRLRLICCLKAPIVTLFVLPPTRKIPHKQMIFWTGVVR